MKVITNLTFIAVMLASQMVQAHPGIGIVRDSKGNIFYTDLHQVWKIGKDGKKQVVVKGVHTHELFMDENDNLFGEHVWYNGEAKDTWGHYVWKYDAKGSFEKVIPDSEGFLENYSFVRDHLGRMYWADRSEECQHVKRLNSDKSTSILGDACLKNIRWMKSSDNGNVYLVDLADLKVVDQEGKITTIARDVDNVNNDQSKDDRQHSVFGIWDDPEGNIYTAVYSARVVKKFSKNGTVEVAAETNSPWAPTGGLVDGDGNLWLLLTSATNETRVDRIDKNKKRTSF